jgi:hypothetical protein
VDLALPVSRQHERDLHRHYGFPTYWGYASVWGMGAFPGLLASGNWAPSPEEPSSPPSDAHLRSAREVLGYQLRGTDDRIGHVADFIVDDRSWAIRYLVIDTSHWWFGKRVLVAPSWAKRISWEEKTVFVDLSREAVKASPEWIPTEAVNREYETHLHDYYGRPVYWEDPARARARNAERPGPLPPR